MSYFHQTTYATKYLLSMFIMDQPHILCKVHMYMRFQRGQNVCASVFHNCGCAHIFDVDFDYQRIL